MPRSHDAFRDRMTIMRLAAFAFVEILSIDGAEQIQATPDGRAVLAASTPSEIDGRHRRLWITAAIVGMWVSVCAIYVWLASSG